MDVDKISVLIERLSIINTKIFFLEEEKRKYPKRFIEIQKKIDYSNLERRELKNALDTRLSIAIKEGYNPFIEERTYER